MRFRPPTTTKRPAPPSLPLMQAHIDAWNAKVPIGSKVEYRSIIEGPEYTIMTTASRAVLLENHTSVIWLEEKAGCVALAACRPLTDVQGEVSP